MSFGERLAHSMAERGPLCVGIDPHASLLKAWGLEQSVTGLEQFAMAAVEGLAPYAAAVKPQSAFFERFGSRGIAVLERVIADSRDAGAQVILDVKRGDIGSTSQAYAEAYLDQSSPLAADAITASPYLGFGSLAPLFEAALLHESGVFVLALTSNPEGAQVQRAVSQSGRSVAGEVLAGLADLNQGASPMGSYGAVVGATIADTDEDFGFNGPILVPGLGAQGGTSEDVRRLFGTVVSNVVPSSSREVLVAGPGLAGLRDATRRRNDELRRMLTTF